MKKKLNDVDNSGLESFIEEREEKILPSSVAEGNIKVSIEFIGNKNQKIPEYQTKFSSGVDLVSVSEELIMPDRWCLVSTGIKIAIPVGYEGQIRSRSGLSLKSGIFVLNSPGTIDSDYRGEIQVILMNLSPYPFKVNIGDRIAQLVINPVIHVTFAEEHLFDTDRGNKGFGSTGV